MFISIGLFLDIVGVCLLYRYGLSSDVTEEGGIVLHFPGPPTKEKAAREYRRHRRALKTRACMSCGGICLADPRESSIGARRSSRKRPALREEGIMAETGAKKERKTEGVRNLVKEVLVSLPENLLTEDVTDEVLFFIENNRMEDYGKLVNQLGKDVVVNQWIGKWTKDLLEAETIENAVPSKKNNLSCDYTTLKFDRKARNRVIP